eukprot:g1077.t1
MIWLLFTSLFVGVFETINAYELKCLTNGKDCFENRVCHFDLLQLAIKFNVSESEDVAILANIKRTENASFLFYENERLTNSITLKGNHFEENFDIFTIVNPGKEKQVPVLCSSANFEFCDNVRIIELKAGGRFALSPESAVLEDELESTVMDELIFKFNVDMTAIQEEVSLESKAEVDKYFSFSGNLGAEYHCLWKSSHQLSCAVLDRQGQDEISLIGLGTLQVSLRIVQQSKPRDDVIVLEYPFRFARAGVYKMILDPPFAKMESHLVVEECDSSGILLTEEYHEIKRPIPKWSINEEMVFDGTSSVTLSDAFINDMLSLCSWVWMPPFDPNSKNAKHRTLFFKGHTNGHRTPSAFFLPHSNHLTLRLSTSVNLDTGIQSGTEIPQQAWSHLCFVIHNDTREDGEVSYSLYINGTIDASLQISKDWVIEKNVYPLHIGQDPYKSLEGFSGLLKHLQIYDTPLASKHIARIYTETRKDISKAFNFILELASPFNALKKEPRPPVEDMGCSTILHLLDAVTENETAGGAHLVDVGEIFTFGSPQCDLTAILNPLIGLQYLEMAAFRQWNPKALRLLAQLCSRANVNIHNISCTDLFKLSALGGDARSKLSLAVLHHSGEHENCETALHYYSQIAKTTYLDHHAGGLEQSPQRNIISAETEHLIGQGQTGEDDNVFAYESLRAEQGNIDSMIFLGNCYYFGHRGVQRNHAEAFRWFRQASDLGSPAAQTACGNMLLKGEGTTRNHTLALTEYTSAIDQNYSRAMNGLGVLYFHGEIIEKNLTKAFELFNRSATLGATEGHYLSSICLLFGKGTKVDVKLAMYHLNIASQRGHFDAIYLLGKLYIGDIEENEITAKIPVDEDALTVIRKTLPDRSCIKGVEHFKAAAEYGKLHLDVRRAFDTYLSGNTYTSTMMYLVASSMGFKEAIANAAYLIDCGHIEKFIFETSSLSNIESQLSHGNASDTCLYRQRVNPIIDNLYSSLVFTTFDSDGHISSRLADLYFTNGQMKQAYKYYQKSASKGDVFAAYRVGEMINKGLIMSGLPPNSNPVTTHLEYHLRFRKALRYFKLALQNAKEKKNNGYVVASQLAIIKLHFERWVFVNLGLNWSYSFPQSECANFVSAHETNHEDFFTRAKKYLTFRPGAIDTKLESSTSAEDDIRTKSKEDVHGVVKKVVLREKIRDEVQKLKASVQEKKALERENTPKGDPLVRKWSNIMNPESPTNRKHLLENMELSAPKLRASTTDSFTVSWQHVEESGQSSVQRYECQWKISPSSGFEENEFRASVQSDEGIFTPCTCFHEYSNFPLRFIDKVSRSLRVCRINGLSPGIIFRVRALSRAGYGMWSKESAEVTNLDKHFPAPIATSCSERSLELKWDSFTNNIKYRQYKNLIHFSLFIRMKNHESDSERDQEGWSLLTETTASKYSVLYNEKGRRLKPGTQYEFFLTVESGDSAFISSPQEYERTKNFLSSDVLLTQTNSTVPDKPECPVLTLMADGIEVAWRCENDNGSPITNYTLLARRKGGSRLFSALYSGEDPLFFVAANDPDNILRLEPLSTYEFKVNAQNEKGSSSFSSTAEIIFMTEELVGVAEEGQRANHETNGEDELNSTHNSLDESSSEVTTTISSPLPLEPSESNFIDLPEGWIEYFDPETKDCYYHNTITGTVTWVHPNGESSVDTMLPFRKKRFMLLHTLRLSRNTMELLTDEKLEIRIRRSHLVPDSVDKLRTIPVDHLLRRLRVVYDGEDGIDSGGLTKDWYLEICRNLCYNASYCLFRPNDDGTVEINPLSGVNPQHLQYFRFLGRLLAKAIYDRQLVDVLFCTHLFKGITGGEYDIDDLRCVDPHKYKSFVWMSENSIDGIIFETFSMERDVFGKTEKVDFVENGNAIDVTDENKHAYIKAYLHFTFRDDVEQQLNALREGFYELVPYEAIQNFSAEEMKLLLNGRDHIDVDDWYKVTSYSGGYTQDSEVVCLFWDVVRDLDQEDVAKLLRFATGTTRLPYENFKFTITLPSDANIDELPRAHTCFNQLVLPPYTTSMQLKAKLLYALNSSNGFYLT